MGTANGMHSFDSALYQNTFADLTNPSNVPATLSTITGGWGEIGDVISINGVPMERTVTQLTHLSSPDKLLQSQHIRFPSHCPQLTDSIATR